MAEILGSQMNYGRLLVRGQVATLIFISLLRLATMV